jgi:glycosyltransferase involved in cell wall biosynthesis
VLVVADEASVAHVRVSGLLGELGARDELVIVDNGSTDGTADALFDRYHSHDQIRIVGLAEPAADPEAVGAHWARKRPRSVASGRPIAGRSPIGNLLAPPLPSRNPDAGAAAGRVILMPAAAYHLDELGPLADELERRGQPCAFYATGWRWKHVERPLRRFRQPILDWDGPGPWVDGAAGFVTLNDWGEPLRDILERATDRGIPTFAKVEGVQDFEDVDVHWDRRAYRTAGVVLCQGDNDVAALEGSECVVVGNSRLERIWRLPNAGQSSAQAIINLNFTYGVMEDARDGWLVDAAAASREAGFDPIVSRHPAEHGEVIGVPVASAPIAHLLTRGGVLITRFSTVPYEAIARGVPFVYYNPHGEQVATFQHPDGAFEIAASRHELVSALEKVRADRDGRSPRAEAFFRAQVDIDPDRSSAERCADAILSRIATRSS